MTPEEEFTKSATQHVKTFGTIAQYLNEWLYYGLGLNGYKYCDLIVGHEIRCHDESKFKEPELSAYANHFFGADDKPRQWRKALQHHYMHNDHHPQYWAARPEPMPHHCCTAMVADWLAASWQYTGSLDMTEFLDERWGRERTIPLDEDAAYYTRRLLRDLGYIDNWLNAPLWAWLERDWANGLIEKLED